MGPDTFGNDIQFLLDTDAGFMIRSVTEIAAILEADSCYPEDPGRMDGTEVFILSHRMPPQPVQIKYFLVAEDDGFNRKTIQIVDLAGGIIAQARYREHLPTREERTA